MTLALSTSIVTTGRAQKVKTKNFNAQYFQLPAEPLPKHFSTYSLVIRATGQDLRQLNTTEEVQEHSYFKLNQFQQLEQGGHFHISVTINPFQVISVEDKVQRSTSKDKDGNTVQSNRYYKWIKSALPIPCL